MTHPLPVCVVASPPAAGSSSPGGRGVVVLLAMTRPANLPLWPVPARRSTAAGRGAYALRALPDVCFGIVSGRLGHLHPGLVSWTQLLESPGSPRGLLLLSVLRRRGSRSRCPQLGRPRPGSEGR